MSEKLYPTPDWLIAAYPGWAEIWREENSQWSLDELKTFDKCPADIEERCETWAMVPLKW